MQIHIRETDRPPLKLVFPTGLVLNPISAQVLSRTLRANSICISAQQTARLIQALNIYRKNHKDWILLDVECADGDHITIQL